MGLERIAAVMQNVHDNYDIDLFSTIINKSQGYCGNIENKVAHMIIADHLRSAAFLIAEGMLPGNEGRSYALRRLIRRAACYLPSASRFRRNLGSFFATYKQKYLRQKFWNESYDKHRLTIFQSKL
ncbi:Alanine--tRNA ligase [Dirofilaria immitis]